MKRSGNLVMLAVEILLDRPASPDRSTEGGQPFVAGCRGGSALLGSRDNAHWRVEGSRPHRVKGEAPCPGKVDVCVNLYWVLPDADFRRICGFAALPRPRNIFAGRREIV